MVSNWLRCQIGPGVKLTLLHSWCQIGPVSNWCRCQIDSFTLLVSNWYRCQIDSFTLLVSNCPPHTLGVKLTPVSNWCQCQIVLQPSVRVQRHRQNGNMKVQLTNWLTSGVVPEMLTLLKNCFRLGLWWADFYISLHLWWGCSKKKRLQVGVCSKLCFHRIIVQPFHESKSLEN